MLTLAQQTQSRGNRNYRNPTHLHTVTSAFSLILQIFLSLQLVIHLCFSSCPFVAPRECVSGGSPDGGKMHPWKPMLESRSFHKLFNENRTDVIITWMPQTTPLFKPLSHQSSSLEFKLQNATRVVFLNNKCEDSIPLPLLHFSVRELVILPNSPFRGSLFPKARSSVSRLQSLQPLGFPYLAPTNTAWKLPHLFWVTPFFFFTYQKPSSLLGMHWVSLPVSPKVSVFISVFLLITLWRNFPFISPSY